MRFFLVLLISFSLNAEEGFDDSGFDDNFSDELSIQTKPPEKGSVYGSVDLESHYNFSNNTGKLDLNRVNGFLPTCF
jgi:hypothetical protein